GGSDAARAPTPPDGDPAPARPDAPTPTTARALGAPAWRGRGSPHPGVREAREASPPAPEPSRWHRRATTAAAPTRAPTPRAGKAVDRARRWSARPVLRAVRAAVAPPTPPTAIARFEAGSRA